MGIDGGMITSITPVAVIMLLCIQTPAIALSRALRHPRSVVVHAFLRARLEAGTMLAREESGCAKHSLGFRQAGPAR
jgi:hypothetical protein